MDALRSKAKPASEVSASVERTVQARRSTRSGSRNRRTTAWSVLVTKLTLSRISWLRRRASSGSTDMRGWCASLKRRQANELRLWLTVSAGGEERDNGTTSTQGRKRAGNYKQPPGLDAAKRIGYDCTAVVAELQLERNQVPRPHRWMMVKRRRRWQRLLKKLELLVAVSADTHQPALGIRQRKNRSHRWEAGAYRSRRVITVGRTKQRSMAALRAA